MVGLHAYRHKRIIPTFTDDEQDCIKAVINAKKYLIVTQPLSYLVFPSESEPVI